MTSWTVFSLSKNKTGGRDLMNFKFSEQFQSVLHLYGIVWHNLLLYIPAARKLVDDVEHKSGWMIKLKTHIIGKTFVQMLYTTLYGIYVIFHAFSLFRMFVHGVLYYFRQHFWRKSIRLNFQKLQYPCLHRNIKESITENYTRHM